LSRSTAGARQAVSQARAFIAQRGFGSSADGIRRCRQEIMALDDDGADQVRHGFRRLLYGEQLPRPPIPRAGAWSAFEADNPHTFAGMYQFWVQKQ
jgi:hypothetical protein